MKKIVRIFIIIIITIIFSASNFLVYASGNLQNKMQENEVTQNKTLHENTVQTNENERNEVQTNKIQEDEIKSNEISKNETQTNKVGTNQIQQNEINDVQTNKNELNRNETSKNQLNNSETNKTESNETATYNDKLISTNESKDKIGIYKICVGADPNKSLEIAGSSKENNAKVGLWDYGNATAQKFNFEYIDGYYKITARHTGKSLTVKDNELKENAEIVQSDYIGLDGQKWILRDSKKNGWLISPLSAPNLSISIQGNIVNGANIVLLNTQSTDNQMFYLYNINKEEKVQENGIYKIAVGVDSNKTLEVAGSDKANGAKVDIWNYGNVAAQKFYFEYKEGYYKISAMHTGKSLTAKENNIKEGTEIVQSDYKGLDGQKWILRDSKKNGWIISPLSNPSLSLTVQGSISNGDKMILSNTNDNDNQMYYLFNLNISERTHDDDIYKIAIGADSNKTIEVAGSSKENNAKVDIWDYGNVPAQKFKFEYQEGYYKIIATHTGKSLTVKDNNIKEGIEIVQRDYKGLDGQKWILRDTKKNGWVISLLNNPDLSISVDGKIVNGSKIILSTTKDNDNQMLYIMPPLDKNIKEGLYGKSGLMYKGNGGSYLKYYQIGTGKKHLFLNFSIHGFEDSYDKDGAELTYMANEFWKYLKDNMSEELIQEWTVYILPVSNPDGQYNGWTNQGPGRTTVYSWAPENKGIDMNRCFPVGWTKLNSSRNYTGEQPLQAYEAEALREFILTNVGNENFVIDVHGWLNETIGNNELGSFYRDEFGISNHIGTYGKGYFIQWARSIPNTKSMLLELPEVKSHNELMQKGYVNKFNTATMNLLKSY
ncbi:MAG: RICIN domain-containing protein [Clostridium sp.]|nr:RICIN domain-containing protein [Clostridium sp.]